jgi:hypothetical protein
VPYPVEGVEIVSTSGLFTGGLAPPPRDAAALDPPPASGATPDGNARRRRGPGTSGQTSFGRSVIDE